MRASSSIQSSVDCGWEASRSKEIVARGGEHVAGAFEQGRQQLAAEEELLQLFRLEDEPKPGRRQQAFVVSHHQAAQLGAAEADAVRVDQGLLEE